MNGENMKFPNKIGKEFLLLLVIFFLMCATVLSRTQIGDTWNLHSSTMTEWREESVPEHGDVRFKTYRTDNLMFPPGSGEEIRLFIVGAPNHIHFDCPGGPNEEDRDGWINYRDTEEQSVSCSPWIDELEWEETNIEWEVNCCNDYNDECGTSGVTCDVKTWYDCEDEQISCDPKECPEGEHGKGEWRVTDTYQRTCDFGGCSSGSWSCVGECEARRRTYTCDESGSTNTCEFDGYSYTTDNSCTGGVECCTDGDCWSGEVCEDNECVEEEEETCSDKYPDFMTDADDCDDYCQCEGYSGGSLGGAQQDQCTCH